MDSARIKQLSQEYNISEGAIHVLIQALARGNRTMAQFNHPELGGSGQWMPSMIMIGDMFNHELKARVNALCHKLAQEVELPTTPMPPMPTLSFDNWWSIDPTFTTPTATGSQNNSHYAYFRSIQRLLIKREGTIYLYSTTGHDIVGASQQQSNANGVLAFQTTTGVVTEAMLTQLETRSAS